ncbi:hypothetical protein BV25DRAFT_1440654 [Artomyces pyxidatus]|uniref:Uncharacterized protein n=1 Tax=Artomyces pyxidatus TaxID=48021 RepID=A0ACB8SN46_9AGAM|nr:hypothetical protein BV25DRAFT_1440654 [Artomyces pyxidatus]
MRLLAALLAALQARQGRLRAHRVVYSMARVKARSSLHRIRDSGIAFHGGGFCATILQAATVTEKSCNLQQMREQHSTQLSIHWIPAAFSIT